MPRKHVINLITQQDFSVTPLGKISSWALSIGRWIVIVTEIVVIGAFLYRIALDQQIHDLQETAEQKRSHIVSFARQEQNIRQTQKQLEILQSVLKEHKEYEHALLELAKSLPSELALKAIRINEDGSVLQGTARSEQSISTLIDNLRKSAYFTNVNLNRVVSNSEDELSYDFDVALHVNTEK